MNYIIENFPIQTTEYMRRIGAYGIGNYELMTAMKEWAEKKVLFNDSIIYGIAQDNPDITPPEQCRYDVCLIVEPNLQLENDVQHGEIQGGKYAVFTIPHTAESVQEFWGLFMNILQKENLQYDLGKPILERYKHKLVEDGKCEFCVPII